MNGGTRRWGEGSTRIHRIKFQSQQLQGVTKLLNPHHSWDPQGPTEGTAEFCLSHCHAHGRYTSFGFSKPFHSKFECTTKTSVLPSPPTGSNSPNCSRTLMKSPMTTRTAIISRPSRFIIVKRTHCIVNHNPETY